MEWYTFFERCKQFLVVFNCLFFTPSIFTVEFKKSFYCVISGILRTLERRGHRVTNVI